MHKMLTRLRCFCSRFSGQAIRFSGTAMSGMRGFPLDVAVPLKRIACPENREQKQRGRMPVAEAGIFVYLPCLIKMILNFFKKN